MKNINKLLEEIHNCDTKDQIIFTLRKWKYGDKERAEALKEELEDFLPRG